MKNFSRHALVIASSVVASSAFAGPLDASFVSVGGVSVGITTSLPRSLSENGLTLVGASNDPLISLGSLGRLTAFRWNAGNGLSTIESGILGTADSDAAGVSGDGKVIVGQDSYGRPYRWSAATGMQVLQLPGLVTAGIAKAADQTGVCIAGTYRSVLGTLLTARAFRWTVGGGTVALGDALTPSTSASISADGGTIVGRYGVQAFRWTSAGLVTLGDLPGGAFDSEATDVSGNGSVVVGRGSTLLGTEAFRWTSAGLKTLGDLPGGAVASVAQAVSSDGRVVVGYGTTATGQVAMIWDAINGMRDLKAVLTANGLADMVNGWKLTSATDVTIAPGGLTVISGVGTDASGKKRTFVVSLPLMSNFTSLGTLPGGNFISSARAISADGSYIVGVSSSPTGNRAFVWDNSHGMYDIGTGAVLGCGVSNDGKVVVGHSAAGDAIRWFGTGVTHFGAGSLAKAVSSDGLVTGGCIESKTNADPALRATPCAWTGTTKQLFPTFIGTKRVAAGIASVSANGNVLAGNSAPLTGVSAVSRAFLWRKDGSQVLIPALTGGNLESEATGVSGNGNVVVGWSRGARGPEAFRWTASGGTVGLGNLPGGNASRALAVSPDGNTIVGLSAINGENHAFIWTPSLGMKNLEDFFASRGLSEKIAGWNIYLASGVTVTPKGLIAITGTGTDPNGRVQSFIATLPAAPVTTTLP